MIGIWTTGVFLCAVILGLGVNTMTETAPNPDLVQKQSIGRLRLV